MDNNMQNITKESDKSLVDIRRLIQCVVNKAWQIGIVTFLCGVIAFVGSVMLLTPQYNASALFYINNSSLSLGDATLSISNGDITTSKNLVNSYIVILKSRATLLDVIDYADSNRTYSQLKGMISAASEEGTEVFRVTVTSPDPVEAETLANAIAYVVPDRIASIIEGSSAKVVDYAVLPRSPSSPDNMKNMFLGLLIGFALSAGFVILIEIFDITIKNEEDIATCCNYPILATVPNMNRCANRGRGYKKYYYSKKYSKYISQRGSSQKKMDGADNIVNLDLDFASSEAYKLLRTKLQYSFADEQTCRVFSVSSAMAGEGKSITAAKLSSSLAQLNKRVLLIDCDMRRPSLADKLSLNKFPGLSDHLTGFADLKDMIQTCSVKDTNATLSVITAGNRPPNPVELINSEKMFTLLQQLREQYEYIILDMPPIGEVSDALASAKLADGLLLVVRQNYANRIAVRDAIHQFEFIDTKILGVLFNCVVEQTKNRNKSYVYMYEADRRKHDSSDDGSKKEIN